MSLVLDLLFRNGIGSRIVMLLESFPFFMIGKLINVEEGVVIIESQEGIPIQLVGRIFHISQSSIAAFFIEDERFPIPVLKSISDIHTERGKYDSTLSEEVKEVNEALSEAVGEIKEVVNEAVGKIKRMLSEASGEMKGTMDEVDSKITEIERKHIGRDVLFVLRPKQLSILGQTFRPIIVAKLEKVGFDFVFLKDVNIRFTNAPDFVFPLPLFVPKQQIALFFPFERGTQFPLV